MTEINFADAQQAVGFVTPQLYRIETQVNQTKYPSFDYASLMYVNTDGDMWDLGSVFYSGDIAGQAKFLAGSGFDMPYADVSRTQFTNVNHFAGIGYEWQLQELQRAAKLGRNLGPEKALAARKVAEQFIYGIAIRGNAEKNKTGLINDASVPTTTAAADGAGGGGSSPLWANKTPDQINRDFSAALNAVINNSKETERANRVLLPTTRYQYVKTTRMGAGDGAMTILKFLQENNPEVQIGYSRELETAGGSSSARMIVYSNDRDVVQMHLPGPHTFLPVFQKSSMTWEVGGIMNVGGTEVRRPKGMAYVDGI